MALYAVGVSSFGQLRGRTQFVTDAMVAAQVRSLITESHSVFAGGAVLSVNEGVRSKPDQASKLADWNAYQRGGPWAPLAASPLYTSTHDESRGSALDFGVTMPDGTNRALTMSEHSWVVTRGRQRGIRWTGRDFRPTPETWHFNGGYDAELPPLTDTASGGATPFPTPSEEDDMNQTQSEQLARIHAALFAGLDGSPALSPAVIQTRDAVANGPARFALVRAKGRPEVFLSVDRQSLRWLESEKQLADQRFTLKAVGAGDLPVQEVDNLAAFGAIGANERPETSDNFYARF